MNMNCKVELVEPADSESNEESMIIHSSTDTSRASPRPVTSNSRCKTPLTPAKDHIYKDPNNSGKRKQSIIWEHLCCVQKGKPGYIHILIINVLLFYNIRNIIYIITYFII